MKKPKRKLTAAERRARRERKKNFMTIFINGKQKQVPRPQLIEGLPVNEFIARNADPLWLHQNGYWEYIQPEDMPEQHGDGRPISRRCQRASQPACWPAGLLSRLMNCA